MPLWIKKISNVYALPLISTVSFVSYFNILFLSTTQNVFRNVEVSRIFYIFFIIFSLITLAVLDSEIRQLNFLFFHVLCPKKCRFAGSGQQLALQSQKCAEWWSQLFPG